MNNLVDYVSVMKIIIAVSIFFVWLVRYSNIVIEFKKYGFPSWFRDIMGIIKCSAAVMLLFGTAQLTLIASANLSILMLSAFIVHIKFKHSFIQFLPSLSLFILNAALFLNAFSAL